MKLARLKPRIDRIARELNVDRGTAALLAAILDERDYQPGRRRVEEEDDEDGD